MASAAPLLKPVPHQAQSSGAQMEAQAQPNHAPDSSAADSSKQSPSSTQTQMSTQSQTSDQTQAAPPSTGTAIAPYEKQDGITGSRPAGAAIAAGKQRRTHTFAIRVGLIVGAAIAVGVVAAASEGSPARAN